MANFTQITVVDNDDSVRESLQALVRSVGFAAKVFASAQDFLESEHLWCTHVLLLDVRMPGMNGLELQQRLSEIRCDIPIVFMTAHEDESARLQALKNGAVDYLFKPFSEDALMKAIYAALNTQLNSCVV
jgi:FixJ family two-component response regulator